jgi:hypothetical protein
MKVKNNWKVIAKARAKRIDRLLAEKRKGGKKK